LPVAVPTVMRRVCSSWTCGAAAPKATSRSVPDWLRELGWDTLASFAAYS
jgi:hypothetical protein